MVTPPLNVCTFESRRQLELTRLIEKFGARPLSAPSLREVPVAEQSAIADFAEQLLAGRFDLVIFLTGVGTAALFAALSERGQLDAVKSELARRLVAARGPKPLAVLSQHSVRVDVKAPEPNTWRVLADSLLASEPTWRGKRVAIQEYGAPSHELYGWLRQQGAEVTPVPVYRWALPEDLKPLQSAIQKIIAGEVDVLLWTSAQQVVHAAQVAGQMGVREQWNHAAASCVIGSIGPTASERLREYGLPPDLEPSHPKMAHLVRETLAAAPTLLSVKRATGL